MLASQTCPLLLRVFPKLNGHHALVEFAERGKEPKDEMQVCLPLCLLM